MLVTELITALKSMEQDRPVMFAYPAHDHANTTLLGEVSVVDDHDALFSYYHDAYKLVADGEADLSVVVLH